MLSWECGKRVLRLQVYVGPSLFTLGSWTKCQGSDRMVSMPSWGGKLLSEPVALLFIDKVQVQFKFETFLGPNHCNIHISIAALPIIRTFLIIQKNQPDLCTLFILTSYACPIPIPFYDIYCIISKITIFWGGFLIPAPVVLKGRTIFVPSDPNNYFPGAESWLQK